MPILVHQPENKVFSATYLNEKVQWQIVNVDTRENVEVGYIDGYRVADRLMEGVLFSVRPHSDGKGFTVESDANDYDYLRKLRMDNWMYEVADVAASTDCLGYHLDEIDILAWKHIIDSIEAGENSNV
jgi:hypothetical protein